MNPKLIVLLVSIFSVTACSTQFKSTQLKASDLTIAEQSSYQRILSADAEGKPVTVLADVEGYFCFRDGNVQARNKGLGSLNEKTAKNNLRINAAKLGADAVIEETCANGGFDLIKNCFSSTTCKAKAVKLN